MTAQNTGLDPRIEALIQKHDGPGKRILEVGSSAGRHTRGLRGHLTVLDLDQDKLARSAQANPGAVVLSHDLNDPAWPVTGPFDLIMCFEVLEHLPRPASLALLGQLEGLSQGLLLISTPNVTNLTQFLRVLLGWSLPYYGSHTLVEKILYLPVTGRFYTQAEAARLARELENDPDLSRHRCIYSQRFFKDRGYKLIAAQSEYLRQKLSSLPLAGPLASLALKFKPLAGTIWAYKITSQAS